MEASKNILRSVIFFTIIFFDYCNGINLGLFAGDKLGGGPLTIKKTTHNSPICINIRHSPFIPPTPKLPKPSKPLKSLLSPKLPKLSSLKKPRAPKLPKPPALSSSSKKIRSALLKPKILPPILLPKWPILPTLLPKRPLIPGLPLIPRLPRLGRLIPKLPLSPLLPRPLLPLPLLPLVPPPLPILSGLKLKLLKTKLGL